MKIIFYGSNDNKLAYLIAYRYLNLVNRNNLNSIIERIFLDNNIDFTKKLLAAGTDKDSNQILALGCLGDKSIVLNLIGGLNHLFSIDEVLLVEINDIYNIFIHLGILACKLRLKKIGVILIKKGIKLQLPQIDKMITRIKDNKGDR